MKEISVRELRIDNWVYEYKESAYKFRQVKSILDDGINIQSCYTYSDEPQWKPSIHFSNLFGIPLSTEILVMAGFENIKHYTVTNSMVLNIGRNRQLSIGYIGTPNEMLFLCEVDNYDMKNITDIIVLHNFDYDGKLYLHKLMNVYHLLTHTELEIKL